MSQYLSRSAWIVIASISVLILGLMIVSPNALWVLLSVPLILFLPGFILTMIFFPRTSFGIPERILLSIGLSIASVALIGLLLNLTPWGLQASTLWIALLLGLVTGGVALYLYRPAGWRDAIVFPQNLNFNTRQWVLMGLAALMTFMAFRIASTPAPQNGLEGYTLLSAQAANTPDAIHLGVRSEEFKQTKYQIKYQIDGNLQDGPMLELNPGETWEQVIPIPVDQLGGKSFTVLLYRLDNPTEVYRHVDWWPETR
jgi:uncharacterized membrane protein